MIKLKEEQEKLLENIISKLESERASLDQNKGQNRPKIEEANSKIVEAYSQLSQVREEKTNLIDEREKDHARDTWEQTKAATDTMNMMAAGLAQIIDQSGQGLARENPNDVVAREFAAQNQIVIEQQLTGHQQVADNPSKDLKSPQDLLKDEVKKIEDGIKDAYEASGKTELPERPKPDAQLKWENDIAQKEKDQNDSYQKQTNALDKNKLMLEIQMEDAKKFSDAEKKLGQLKPLEEVLKKEGEKIEGKHENAKEELNREKETLQKAVESTKEMEQAARNKEIQAQREEFERQREIERQRQLEEQNRTR